MTEAADSWRQVTRGDRGSLKWSLGAIALLAVLGLANAENPRFSPWLLALAAAYAVFGISMILLPLVIALGADRFWPPPEVPPPPEDDPSPTEGANWLRAPRVRFPLLANAKGQCGWVKVRLRADRQGRIGSFDVVEQAPDGVFEHAVSTALIKARLPPDPEGEALREVVFVTVFLAPGKHAPSWARERMTATAQAPPVGPGGAAL